VSEGQNVFFTILIVTMVSFSFETIQYFIEDRTTNLYDVISRIIGACLGIYLSKGKIYLLGRIP
jgi:VanZ family protein